MANYLFVESRDPYGAGDTQRVEELVRGIRQRGNTVTVFLVQNGVLSTRPGAKFSERYADLTRSGITVLADEFSLRERAIERLAEGVQKADIGQLVDLLFVAGTKAIWH
ncbi:sulfur reduction protein DsrE [Burkholderia cepacia]|uniref:Sulfur reduction protein DsrE n=2 Tax=Burkholderia cepacia TaxID=292 RepID=A0A0J5WHT7_BURCE|nr:sulfur reduction protein DsrE [Burkholderia cepacia]